MSSSAGIGHVTIRGFSIQTHLRWFTTQDGIALLQDAGLRIDLVAPNYWTRGWRLRLLQLIAQTPLKRFVAPQNVFVGAKP